MSAEGAQGLSLKEYCVCHSSEAGLVPSWSQELLSSRSHCHRASHGFRRVGPHLNAPHKFGLFVVSWSNIHFGLFIVSWSNIHFGILLSAIISRCSLFLFHFPISQTTLCYFQSLSFVCVCGSQKQSQKCDHSLIFLGIFFLCCPS